MMFRSVLMKFVLVAASLEAAAQTPAFPGAEGFGATASGGRGGQVLFVTNTNTSGPGSLQAALDTPGPRYILFRCSGVVDGAVEIPVGSSDFTIAGQTSPRGIIVRGMSAYNDTAATARNLIIRHLRFRASQDLYYPGASWLTGDGLSLGGVHRAIIDHCSMAHALDEEIDISRSSAITIQNCLLAETLEEHYDRGGLLTNYRSAVSNLDSLSIHHNTFNRIGGRHPEFSCESPACYNHRMHAEVSCNLFWDQLLPTYYNASISPGGTDDYYYQSINFVNNHSYNHPHYGSALFESKFLSLPQNEFYMSGNTMNLYPSYSDYELVYCCNDFPSNAPNADPGLATHLSSRLPYPAITYTPTANLLDYMGTEAGAFPRDPMDERLMGYVIQRYLLPLPLDTAPVFDALQIANTTAGVLPDGDDDGMPDYWETAQGLNPNAQDHNGTSLSVPVTGTAGYTNLEVYLNCLADALVHGSSVPCGISVGVASPQPSKSFNIFPNPATQTAVLTLSQAAKGDVHIRTLLGDNVRTLPAKGLTELTLPLSGLPRGIYLIEVDGINRRLVLQ
jgi:pectate lyase